MDYNSLYPLVFVGFVLASLFFLLAGIWKLVSQKKYKESIVVILIIVGVVVAIIMLIFIGRKQTGDHSFWFYTPAVLLLFYGFISGFIMRNYVDNHINPKKSSKPTQKPIVPLWRRIVGWILIILSTSIWTYGIFYPFIGSMYIVILTVLMFGFFGGLSLLYSGEG